MNRTLRIKALLLLNKGLSYRQVAEELKIGYWLIFKYLNNYYTLNKVMPTKVYFGAKKEPYYNNEFMYGSVPEYKYEDLNETEKQLYYNNLK